MIIAYLANAHKAQLVQMCLGAPLPKISGPVVEIPVSSRKDSRKVPVRDTCQSDWWPDWVDYRHP